MLNYRRIVNESVNFWFQTPKRDSISPAETIMQFNNLFLEGLKYRKFTLACSEKYFRVAMCEAICTMFLAKKKNTTWRGPLSEMSRPEGWSYANEVEWLDIIKTQYIGYDFFDSLWSRIEKAIWENSVSDWRTTFEIFVLHYIAIEPDLLSDGYDIDMGNDRSHNLEMDE